MRHHNPQDLAELDRSFKVISDNGVLQKQTILPGDFNCSYIDWENGVALPGSVNQALQQILVDVNSDFRLPQVHNAPITFIISLI